MIRKIKKNNECLQMVQTFEAQKANENPKYQDVFFKDKELIYDPRWSSAQTKGQKNSKMSSIEKVDMILNIGISMER